MSDPLAAVAELPGVATAVERARDGVDVVLAHRVLRRAQSAVSVECSVSGAVSAARLQLAADRLDDGVAPARDAVDALDLVDARDAVDAPDSIDGNLDLEDVRELVRAGMALSGEAQQRAGSGRWASATQPVVRGAIRISAELGHLGTAWERAPLQVLARLHVLAASGVVPDVELGRPRRDADDVGSLRGALPEALPAAEVAARLDDLVGLLTLPTRAPAVVLAAVVHGELLVLRPFAWGNVLVALAAQRLVLASRGVDPRGVTIPEAGYAEQGIARYRAAASAYASGTPEGVAVWVRHCAESVRIGARDGLAICETVARLP